MAMAMAMAAALFILLIAAPAVLAVDYTVGDTSGWTQSGDYTTWAAGKTFSVGDTLLFNYGGSHGVDQVNKADYDSCTTGNAITSSSSGPTTITLDKAGPYYFICPSFGHCGSGMKLAVTVGKASTTPTTPTTPTTTPTTPTTTSPPSDETPSTPGTSPDTPTTPTKASPTPSGAAAGSLSGLVIGFSVVVATLVAY